MIVATALMLLCLPRITRAFHHLNIGRVNRFNCLLKSRSPHRSSSSYSSQKFGSLSEVNLDKMNNTLTDIILTQEEDELFSTLSRVVEEESLGTTVRVAGGWVRDKLLGVSGKEDIDIALDNMAGNDFAIAVNKWHISKGLKSFRIGVIQSNPEKSKHLETATVQLGRFSVDFVNLRTETYAEDSRIPEMSFGTPEEDAMRRDLTINSLFYNIHTKCVEDYSKRGVQDLKTGIVSTPLPALLTLQDDPLRLLRAVRFACRFSFDIAPELLTASADSTVRVALGTKVSRERVFHEVEQMLKGKSSARAVCLLHYVQLIPLILPLPSLQNICLASTEATLSTNIASRSDTKNSTAASNPEGGDANDKKKKKKNNNDVEPPVVLTPHEAAFVRRSTYDFHPYGCSAALIHTLLEKSCVGASSVVQMVPVGSDSGAEGMEKGEGEGAGGRSSHTASTRSPGSSSSSGVGCIDKISHTLREKAPFLLHFLRDLSTSQSEETGKVLRFSALTALGYQLSLVNSKKKKFNNPLTEQILLVDLKMRSKDVESAVIIQSSSLVFTELIKSVLTYNKGGRTANVPTDTSRTGPRHGALCRLQVGLAVRKAGALYPQAIQLALSHLILERLVSASDSSSSRSGNGSGKMETEDGQDTVLMGGESVYYGILDALVTACEVTKMEDAISNYRTHSPHPAIASTLREREHARLLERLSSDDVIEIITACDGLLQALAVLDLSESYKLTPLLPGDQMKQVLRNIPKGTMFGEVMQSQVLWMLCNPTGTVQDFTQYVIATFPDWQ